MGTLSAHDFRGDTDPETQETERILLLVIHLHQGFPVTQTVKTLPAMWETWVRSLGWEDPLEEGTASHSSILAWRIPMDRGAWWAIVHEVTKSWARLSD